MIWIKGGIASEFNSGSNTEANDDDEDFDDREDLNDLDFLIEGEWIHQDDEDPFSNHMPSQPLSDHNDMSCEKQRIEALQRELHQVYLTTSREIPASSCRTLEKVLI